MRIDAGATSRFVERYRGWLGALLAALTVIASSLGHGQERKDREFRECPDCPEMVGIPAGKFAMGSPRSEPGRFDSEGPQREVSVTAFALGKYNVTSQQFLTFLKDTTYQPVPCDRMLGLGWRSPRKGLAYAPSYDEPPKWPAVCLDWRDAAAFIAWLNARVRRLRPNLATTSGPYRLPSEAEWSMAPAPEPGPLAGGAT